MTNIWSGAWSGLNREPSNSAYNALTNYTKFKILVTFKKPSQDFTYDSLVNYFFFKCEELDYNKFLTL